MDPAIASFWGSAFGGGMMASLSAFGVFFLTLRQSKKVWARDLRMAAFNDVLVKLDRWGLNQFKMYELVVDEKWDAFERVPRPEYPPSPSGNFYLASTPKLRQAYESWQWAAAHAIAVLAEAAAVRKSIAADPAREAFLEENELKNRSNDELQEYMERDKELRLEVIRLMQANLGLNRADMLSDE